MESVGIAIPYHGDRSRWTLQTIVNLHVIPWVKEIVIAVDKTPDQDVQKLLRVTKNYKKVKVFESNEHLFVFRNKFRAVSLCSTDWVAMIDSDNIIPPGYLNKIFAGPMSKDVIYCPELGTPNLKYTELLGIDITLAEAVKRIDNINFDTFLNTANYVFHRKTWMDAVRPAINDTSYDPVSVDAIFSNLQCLKAGMVMRVVKGCAYKHTVHEGSTYVRYELAGIQELPNVKRMYREVLNANMGSTSEVQTEKYRGISASSNWTATGGSNRAIIHDGRPLQVDDRSSTVAD